MEALPAEGSPAAEILAEIRRVVPLYAGVTRRGLGKQGARWPFSVGEHDANGKPELVGNSYLTWEMAEHGVSGGAGNVEPALSRTQGERN